MASSKQTTGDTLVLLDERLRRVNYALYGDSEARDSEPSQTTTRSAIAHLRALERTLAQLRARSPAASEVLALQKAHPSLFHPHPSNLPSTLPPSQLAALILAHSQLYTSVSANLTQLQDTRVPDPAGTVKLLDLAPRIEKARVRQEKQAREVAELRARSARVVEQWLEVGMLGMSERWAEWEERLREVEIVVRRREGAKRRENGMV
ncbi:hypothetical protein LTR29_006879 [Friedmanniomyces endolithicus]|uniref:Nuclear distribution protein RO10 n=1 Tax=Friedmanniomyces endolithicus TaxID=329885 RepID=A0A4U0VDW7_9PEZI|nr:hypothetical protein LTS09_002116 [Friedmanniomyces endolithicus]KAK0941500.1 hypothetical protein LTR29_006879 [Friedmanniomyces endolithicus]KAK1817015.1 hypothetical protein LTR12_008615 [Friedmanniomyces endolithicus]TKA47251.1 hypothetical protein B0A54_02729 [Friedmanniomyces endolithicus]